MFKRFNAKAALLARKSKAKVATAVALAAPVAAMATPGDYDAITAAVSWTNVGIAIAAIAALKAAPLVIKVGSRMVLSMIGR